MPEAISYFTFIAMVATIMVNVVCSLDHKEAKKHCKDMADTYEKLCFEKKQEFWKIQGAYPAPENDEYYLDLDGGIRLIIYEGKIEGWYMP